MKTHSPAPNYPITVNNVREVALHGSADLAYWQAELGRYSLVPFSDGGKAKVTLNATALRWMNLPSREFIISVAVSSQPNGSASDAALLVYAFNSSRLFSWVERARNSSPYYSADISVRAELPSSFQVSRGARRMVVAQMSVETPATRSAAELWEGVIWLPPLGPNMAATLKYFCARLGGETMRVPFRKGDLFELQKTLPAHVYTSLLESRFVPQEWHVRLNAVHSKSNTFTRKG